MWIFSFFLRFSKKNRGYNREKISSITYQILECDMKYCTKPYPKFVTLRLFFKKSKKN